MADRPRRTALEVLREVEAKGCFADKAMARSLKGGSLDSRDRGLVAELVKGTLRWQGRIDYFLGKISKRPLSSVPSKILQILRLGAYQILFLDRVPDWAAVNESTELARQFGHEGHVRFVNGILRNLVRKHSAISLPDPSKAVEHLAVKYSFPEWLVRRWIERFGPERAERLLMACNQPPHLTLRVNRRKIGVEEYLTKLAGKVEKAAVHPLCPEGIEVEGTGRVRDLPGYLEGWFYVQDAGAMLIAPMVGAKKGERVLDACAAPGGKSAHLAEIMEDEGEIIALDADPKRLESVGENMTRLGISIVHPEVGDAATVDIENPFDRVLVDAPCSGLGTLRRHPEAKWHKKEEDLGRHQERQLAILSNVRRFVRKGGSLTYSTCSTEPDENEEVIERFLREFPEFTIDQSSSPDKPITEMFDDRGFFHAWPDLHSSDGFFAVRLVKTAS